MQLVANASVLQLVVSYVYRHPSRKVFALHYDFNNRGGLLEIFFKMRQPRATVKKPEQEVHNTLCCGYFVDKKKACTLASLQVQACIYPKYAVK